MGKLLLLVAALFVGVAALRVLVSVRKKQAHAEPQAQACTPAPPANKPPALLPCPHCGVHMAQQELAQHQLSQHPHKPQP